MKMSQLFVQTLRENPADAEVVCHQLLVRAGYIRKLTSGVYNYLPLMMRVLKKVETIVREEMDTAGAQELLMPIIQPEELWQQSGRWDVYGKELMRLEDRHGRKMALGPTHEEVITALARDEIKSYRQLPANLYQIQNKYRDEIRPRFGLLRGREFIMKDAYSFDENEANMEIAYNKMREAYFKIFERCGFPDIKAVRSDSGAIGGLSEEFMVLIDTQSGEDNVIYCNKCSNAANSNWANSKLLPAVTDGGFDKAQEVDTPGIKTIEELSNFFDKPQSIICKTLVYIADGKPVLALIRGDRTVEETKLKNTLGANEIRIAGDEEIKELIEVAGFDAKAGFLGPNGLKARIVGDTSITDLKNFIVGINKNDVHLVGANWGVDLELPKTIADIRLAQEGDICPECENGHLLVKQGIEVGNIFMLGTKYSKKMKSTFTDRNGKEVPFVMGCYGIGISRTASAAVEKYHDDFGIKWPVAIAPFQVVVVPVNMNDELQVETANKLYNELQVEGIEVVLDDREERAGVKFKDADLIGFPLRINVGKTLVEGLVEFKIRETGEIKTVKPEEVLGLVKEIING